MFCKWCGVKRKNGEIRCSKCKMPFDPLFSTGVPIGFPENLHKLKVEGNEVLERKAPENNDLQRENEDNKTDEPLNSNDCRHIKVQNKRLRVAIFVLTGLLVVSIVSIMFLVGQLVKKSKESNDSIENVSKACTSLDYTGVIIENEIIMIFESVSENC